MEWINWSEHNIVFFTVLPFGLCLSDPTLTVENVTEVMGEVVNWEMVGIWLGVPHSKLQEIKQQSISKRDKSHSLGRYWVNTCPDASWVRLGRVLYKVGEERAAVMLKQYLPEGMCIS